MVVKTIPPVVITAQDEMQTITGVIDDKNLKTASKHDLDSGAIFYFLFDRLRINNATEKAECPNQRDTCELQIKH